MADITEDAILDASVRQGELLLYDFHKHMTTLSLLTLGGMLSISQTEGIDVPIRDLLVSIGLISLAGGTSLFGMEAIIKTRMAGRSMPRWSTWYRIVSGASFGIGIGAFLRVVWDALR